MFDFIEPGLLAWAAGGLYAVGYLVINQVILRILVLFGTGFYIWYYAVVADVPLWDAILASIILGTANVIGMINLFLYKSRIYIPRAHRDVYDERFSHMPPADFRTMIKAGRRETVAEDLMLTVEGGTVDKLYFVISGQVTIEKLGEIFRTPAGMFVGEIAYLTGRKSSATTYVPAGTQLMVWDFDTLRKHSERKPRFKLAFEAMISRDLANKVSFAVAPHSKRWAVDQAQGELAQA